MIDGNKLWSSVGSAGIVDPADIGKVVFAGPVAQMPGVVLAPPQTAATAAAPSPTKAIIRYPVTPGRRSRAPIHPNRAIRFERARPAGPRQHPCAVPAGAHRNRTNP